MSRRVFIGLTVKYENVRKGAGDRMGGVVLDFEGKRIHDDGIRIGEERGIAIGGITKAVAIVDKLISEKDMSMDEACEFAEITVHEYMTSKGYNEYLP